MSTMEMATVTETLTKSFNDFKRELSSKERNISDDERIASLIGGGLLALHGLTSGRVSGLLPLSLGAALLWRGATGHCQVYHALNYSTSERT